MQFANWINVIIYVYEKDKAHLGVVTWAVWNIKNDKKGLINLFKVICE